MKHQTETGPELSQAIHTKLFNDDLSCFKTDGSERRDRIEKAIHRIIQTIREPDFPIPGEYRLKIDNKSWDAKSWDIDTKNALWLWDNRAGQLWQTALTDYITSFRDKPDPFHKNTGLALDLLFEVTKRKGRRFNIKTPDGVFPDEFDILVEIFEGGKTVAEGQALYTEFPEESLPIQQQLALCVAICRCVLNLKSEYETSKN